MLANFQAAFVFDKITGGGVLILEAAKGISENEGLLKCQQSCGGRLHFSYIFQRLTTTSEPWLRWKPLVRNEWWI